MIGSKMESYLLLLTFLLYGVVDGGLDKCGKNVGDLGKYTQVRMTDDGFCSNQQSKTSCCTSWNGLVNPALDTLLGKQNYEKFHELSSLLRNLKQSITDLECHKHGNPSGSIHSDIVSSIDLLSEVNWSHILNSTFSGSKCGMELTKLMYCSPNYCLYNQTVGPVEHFCHGHCTNIIKHCVTAPFAELLKDWKRAIGSLSASLRLLSTKTTCAGDKLKIDARVGELNDWREPLFGVINSCSTSGLNSCWPNVDPEFAAGVAESVKSLVNHGEHEKKLKSISSSLEKHWQDPEGLSQGDDPDDPASVPSGSGWGMNEPYTDDEDLFNFPYGSGGGSGMPDGVPEEGVHRHPDGTISGSAGTLSPPTQTNKNNDNDITDKDVAPPNNSGKKPSSSSNNLKLSSVLILVIVPLISLLSRSYCVKIT